MSRYELLRSVIDEEELDQSPIYRRLYALLKLHYKKKARSPQVTHEQYLLPLFRYGIKWQESEEAMVYDIYRHNRLYNHILFSVTEFKDSKKLPYVTINSISGKEIERFLLSFYAHHVTL